MVDKKAIWKFESTVDPQCTAQHYIKIEIESRRKHFGKPCLKAGILDIPLLKNNLRHLNFYFFNLFN